MVEHAVVINVSRYRPAAGQREELLAGMRRIAELAALQEDCYGAQACTSSRDPDTLIAVSRWKSEEALNAFSTAAASTAEQDRLTGLLDRPPDHENLIPL